MGIIRVEQKKNYRRIEIEELRRISLSCAGIIHRKRYENNNNIKEIIEESEDPLLDKLVCVTSGISYLGIAIVNQLVIRGYSVRVMVHSEEEAEKVREMQMSGEMKGNSNNVVEAVMANSAEIESLTEAFNGCCGVFHIGALIDPSGVSGYSKSKVDVEVETTRKIIEACAATGSVRGCVLTSSLLACIWHDTSLHVDTPSIIDHTCWSEESVCMIKKLWYALGKLKAEKAAMEAAKETELKLATVCTALITGPESYSRNPTPTIAYLKGVREMYADGLLAVVDVNSAAKAHISVLEEMNQKTARGRYLCFDHVIQSREDVGNLSQKTGIDFSILEDVSVNFPPRFVLSNINLSMLTSSRLSCNNK